ncbi:MAG: hypothetical protein IK095_05140 [Oscillospiraceae bacterium]|nr:hypothetical protein [Oscillospiraceae bacterium]
MARPSKATEVLENEKRSHRTKAEIEQRKAAEAAVLTGIRLRESREVREDPVAHEEFLRVRRILTAAGKFDALYEAVINDYCMYKSDIARYTALRAQVLEQEDLSPSDRVALSLDCDRMIEKFKRKRFDIEKENGMTIAASARSIPKKVTQDRDPLLEILGDG